MIKLDHKLSASEFCQQNNHGILKIQLQFIRISEKAKIKKLEGKSLMYSPSKLYMFQI